MFRSVLDFAVSTTVNVLGGRRALPPGHLDTGQLLRWRALRRTADRDDFVAARLLARRLIGAVAGDGMSYNGALTQVCATCGGPHGLPIVADLRGVHVSWAHSHGHVAAAVSTTRVGIDVERVTEAPPPFPSSSSPLLESAGGSGTLDPRWIRWTRTEALIKMGVTELDAAMNWHLDWTAAPGGRVVSLADFPREVVITDLVGPGGTFVASVAGFAVARRCLDH